MGDVEQLATRFEPTTVEPEVIRRWLASGCFHPELPADSVGTYSIAIPPPNVTGELHMGHALNGTIQDTLIRYQRMLGRRTKWILGTDHAGIATQTQVEKRLRSEGLTRQAVGREEFERRTWEWCEHYGGKIVEQFKRLGASCDYQDEQFTFSERYHRAVIKVFIGLYEKGYIYRDSYIVNWDPGSRSVISDLEVDDLEVTDTLYYIKYPLVSGQGTVTIATVRPETMLADVAVAVHPDDPRYKDLIGESVLLPLVGRELPIIADEYVKPEFGTGALKITPAHDPNDFEIGRRHRLETISVIGEDGQMASSAPARYAGMDVAAARELMLEDLRSINGIEKEEDYRHTVPISNRSGKRIEPLISLQWFMRMDELVKPAIQAVKSGRVRIHPDRWVRVYLDWMENIQPWCISRQLWWGHRLPVWYCDECEQTFVADAQPASCAKCAGPLRQEEDVLDTWFSSALWPFVTLGWPDDTPELSAFYPTNVLSTARDILFLWVARMIMMGLEFVGQVPFDDVYIHSVIQASDGRRMSKSLGTGTDPLVEIDKYGADAVRFGLLAMSSSQDVRYSTEKIKQGQALANKLWNAARLILQGVDPSVPVEPRPESVEDRWMLSRLQRIKGNLQVRLAAFEFAQAAADLYAYTYGELCDWYLEFVKARLRQPGGPSADLSSTLLHVLSETLALAHPLIPFVTEQLWAQLPGERDLLVASSTPGVDQALVDPAAEAEVQQLMDAVQALRNWRDSVGAPAGAVLQARLEAEGYEHTADQLAALTRFEFDDSTAGAAAATVAIAGGVVAVAPDERVDFAAAERKAMVLRQRLEADIKRAEGKLANAGFIAKARPEVVQAERDKLAALQGKLAEL